MQEKYNIALVPTSKIEQNIQLSQNFSIIADQYLLSEKSLPHLTLYQFTENSDYINVIWKRMCDRIEQKEIYLTFKEFSCLTFDNEVFWTSLLPDKRIILSDMHKLVAEILNLPVKINYDPHMTLINTKNKDYEHFSMEQLKNYTVIEDTFMLSLGESDEIGQFIKMLYRWA